MLRGICRREYVEGKILHCFANVSATHSPVAIKATTTFSDSELKSELLTEKSKENRAN